MATTSAKKFLELLEKSDLIPTAILKQALVDLKAQVGDASVDFEQLSGYLVNQNLLTEWQCEKLADGKFKGYFLGKYKLLGHLGTGGMSSVFLAEDTISGRLRAIKVLPRKKVSDASYLDRFYLEGRAAAAVDHPNIVRVYDIVGEEETDTHYLVMEYAKGNDLQKMVKASGPIEPELAVKYILQAAIGLQHAHGRKLVHRDIKPANILVGDNGGVKILDLGLALLKSDDDQSLTVQHNERVMGTADYLAPEQAVNSHKVDHRADIYSLGCTFYYLLTGHPPFPDGTLAERILAHQKKEPASILESTPDCPQPLVDIVRKMMQKKRSLRFQDCGELMQALDLYRCGETDCVANPVLDTDTVIELSSSSMDIDVSDVANAEIRAAKGFKIPDEFGKASEIEPAPISSDEIKNSPAAKDENDYEYESATESQQEKTVATKSKDKGKKGKRKKAAPFARWSLVAALALTVSGLGYLLYQRSGGTPNTVATAGSTAQTHPALLPANKPNKTTGTTLVAKKPAAKKPAAKGGNVKFPVSSSEVSSSSNAKKSVAAVLNFDSTELAAGKSGLLTLLDGKTPIGSLRCKSGCELLESSGSLLLHGNSNAVEFRPTNSNCRLDEIGLIAKLRTDNDSLKFEIQVKSALKEHNMKRWQTVYRFDNDVNTLSDSSFTRIRLTDLELGLIDPAPQKFRFLLGGGKLDGVEIDELSIKLSQ